MATTFKIRPMGEQYNTPSTRFKTPDVAASADFEVGAVVFLDDGVTTEAGVNPANILGVATAASDSYDWQKDTQGFVTPSVPVALADEEFRGTLLGTFNRAADLGTEYGITKDVTTGFWVVDKAKTSTNARVHVLGVERVATSEDGISHDIVDGDINVPVTFMFIPEYRQVN